MEIQIRRIEVEDTSGKGLLALGCTHESKLTWNGDEETGTKITIVARSTSEQDVAQLQNLLSRGATEKLNLICTPSAYGDPKVVVDSFTSENMVKERVSLPGFGGGDTIPATTPAWRFVITDTAQKVGP